MIDIFELIDDQNWPGDARLVDERPYQSLLPPNATRLERALEQVMARIAAVPVPIADLWSPARCPVPLLPWLAWTVSVDDWDTTWTEETQRAVIAASVEIHRHKGTLWAMKRALAVAGLGDAEIIEHYAPDHLDGTWSLDGSRMLAPADHWAEYRVTLRRPVTVAQSHRARRILQSVAPARCHLKALDFTAAAHLLDGSIAALDGTYALGVA